jgi:hypothetical protein
VDRLELRQTVRLRRPPAAVVPLLGGHAARLEQLSLDAVVLNAEAQARALRNAQTLYGLDAVVVGGDERWVAVASWVAAAPGTTPNGAWAQIRMGESLPSLPTPEAVVMATPGAVLVDVMRRLRPVLGGRAGIAFALPDDKWLSRQLGHPDVAWIHDLLFAALRLLGGEEPDLLLLVGLRHAGSPMIDNLAGFYGLPVAHVCGETGCQPGVVALPADNPAGWPSRRRADAWLYTTAEAVTNDADPGTVRSAVEALRGMNEGSAATSRRREDGPSPRGHQDKEVSP